MTRPDLSYPSVVSIILPAPARGQVAEALARCADEALNHRGGWVRVDADPAAGVLAWVVSDSAQEIGPFDVPCLIPVEHPCRVRVTRSTGTTALPVIVAWGPGAVHASPDWLVSIIVGTPLTLPPWARWADLDNTMAIGSWLDAGGVTLATFTGKGSRRPAGAVALATSAQTTGRIYSWP